MCAESRDCCDCPLFDTIYCSASPKKRSQEEAVEIVRRVEVWSIAHSYKTRQDVFLEQYPEAAIDNGILELCPRMVSAAHRNQYGDCGTMCESCIDCRYEFWLQEVE